MFKANGFRGEQMPWQFNVSGERKRDSKGKGQKVLKRIKNSTVRLAVVFRDGQEGSKSNRVIVIKVTVSLSGREILCNQVS